MDQREAFTNVLKDYPTNPAAEEALIARSVDEARLTARTAASLLEHSDRDLARSAESFLRSIDDLAIVPLLDVPVPVSPSEATAYIDLVVEPELALRRKVLLKIDALLADRRAVPPAPVMGVAPEERARPRRVCDEAYIAMRAMIHFGEDLADQFAERDKFLSESEDTRDQLIRRARQSATWRRALDREDPSAP